MNFPKIDYTSHGNDQNKFYSYKDLQVQMKTYLKRSNNIPMQVLGWISSIEKRTNIKEAYAHAQLFELVFFQLIVVSHQ